MASKKKSAPATAKNSTMTVTDKSGVPRETLLAQLAVEPCMTAATVSTAFSRSFGDIALVATHAAILERTERVHDGDTQAVESTLVAQAAPLNSIFADLARRAGMNVGEYMSAAETYLKLALRAQNQCRMTLETLANIKNPPVVFAKQANIAHGPQQVNNGQPVTRAEENQNAQTELSRLSHEAKQSLDSGTSATAIRSNPALEAVGALHRAKDT